ncbi:hypothetical protein V7S43_014421 [Phytophthora oleae]|uniref:Uncharacterized protein n=1 Tax=Phytophthora oleae TaxID=2107226 RepID=A0ABD3F3T9_9STRA
MASAAVAFTVDALAPRNDAVLSVRLESKRATDTLNGNWQRVREEFMTLKDVNIVSQLNRAQYAYRLSLRAAASDTQQPAAFPLYLEVPALPSPSSSEEGDICPPEIGAFALDPDQLQYQAEEQALVSTSASQAAVMFSGTLAAALLVYSLLPYVRARNRKRRRSRSRTHSQTSKDRLSWGSDHVDVPTTPTTPNGASRRMWRSLDDDGIEPAGAYRDGLREKKNRHQEATGSGVSETGSELLLAKLPDFNDERGWRDFFDSQIYHNEPQEETRAATKTVSSVKSRRDVTPRETISARSKLLQAKTTSTSPRNDRYRTIRDRIDRAAMEAAMDEAQMFNEFWQM